MPAEPSFPAISAKRPDTWVERPSCKWILQPNLSQPSAIWIIPRHLSHLNWGPGHHGSIIDCSSSQPQFHNAGEPTTPGAGLWISFFALRTNDANLSFLSCAVLHVYPQITKNNSSSRNVEIMSCLAILLLGVQRTLVHVHKETNTRCS